jgi:hypothetical protein
MEDFDDYIERKARKRVQAKKGFYVHFAVYLAMFVFFFLMNLATFKDEGHWWFFFPMLPWGAGLLIHFLVTFGIPGTNILTDGWEEREMEKEMWRMERKYGSPAALPPAEEVELPDLKEREKQKRKLLDEEDFV